MTPLSHDSAALSMTSAQRDPERAAVADPERKPPEADWRAVDGAGGSSETNARLPSEADRWRSRPATLSQANPAGDTGEVGGSPALPATEHDGAASLTVAMRKMGSERDEWGKRRPDWVGWYVVRICPCHFGARITMPFDSRERAEQALAALDGDARRAWNVS